MPSVVDEIVMAGLLLCGGGLALMALLSWN